MTRVALLLALVVGVVGCSGSAKDEADAYEALKPKPMTAAEKEMLEKVKQGGPPPSAHAGATPQ